MTSNLYDGFCHDCKMKVKNRKGHIGKSKGKFIVICNKCKDERHEMKRKKFLKKLGIHYA